MLYDLIQLRKGKETVMMTDSLPKVNNRMKALRKSQRKGIRNERVEYSVRPTIVTEKFKKKPLNLEHGGGGVSRTWHNLR